MKAPDAIRLPEGELTREDESTIQLSLSRALGYVSFRRSMLRFQHANPLWLDKQISRSGRRCAACYVTEDLND